MRKNFNYNFVTKEIVGTKACINRANKGIEPEYSELTSMLREHPDFAVVAKNIKKNPTKKTYGALTFDRMKDYILTQPNANKNLEMFETIKTIADARGAKYPLTKKWFLNTFPEYKENEITLSSNSEELQEEANNILDTITKEVA